MGGCVSLQVSCDKTLKHVSRYLCREASYISKLEANMETLEICMQQLKRRRDDLLRRVNLEEDRGLQCLEEVKGWLLSVEAIEIKVCNLLNARTVEIQRLCLYGFCSKNCGSTYQYGKNVFKKLREVEALKSKGVFEVVAERVPSTKADERPIQPTIGLETMLDKAWNCLMEDEVGILGLYGMGGVGKTTLLTQINNRFLQAKNDFDIVIWVVVSRDLQVERVQEDIGKKLGLFNEEWIRKRQDERAIAIFSVLRRKKFVLLLDDIWKKVSLPDIGIPFPSKENGCKVAFTTRSREVCGHISVDAEIEVQCLESDVAWDLFQKKVGKNTLNSHPDIPELARIVAKKCRGLPLALNVIGGAMACKRTVQEWCHAVHVLTSSASEFSGMEDEILSILKFSYDNLRDEKVKSCFLYCALFPEDYKIYKDWLIDYWLGEGITDGDEGRDRAENEGYEIIGTLVRACLLMENESKASVEMHDVIREMALWIASDFGKQKENYVVRIGAQLRQIPRVKDWKVVRRMSLINNQIEEISGSPACPRLLTLFLWLNGLANVAGEFFLFMPNLVVLDLSGNLNLTELPEEISKLLSLQYLSLNSTGIKRLPAGLKELRKLIYLNLDSTSELRSISGVSSLLNLQVMRLYRSSLPLNLSLVEELRLLKHLKLLTVTLKDASVLERFLSIYKLTSCAQGLYLKDFTSASDGVSLVTTLDGLCYFGIKSSNISEIKIDWVSKGSKTISPLRNQTILSHQCFQNLIDVDIFDCKGLRDLTWLLFAPNLAYLHVERSSQIEEVISSEIAVSATNAQPNILPFLKLKLLWLSNLGELKSIYWSPLPFPYLRQITIRECPKLKKLPLDSKSVGGHNLVIEADKEWKGGVEWEDEATKERFFPN